MYQAKDKIVEFVKRHPYITGSVAAVATGIVGTSLYTGLPLLTCVTTTQPVLKFAVATGEAIIYWPLMAGQWLSSVSLTAQALMVGWGLIKKIEAEDNTMVKNDSKKLSDTSSTRIS